tara:strand:+ start:116 stop:313 length:198 start_codon:yes stop_codon:yes gene_type:complete
MNNNDIKEKIFNDLAELEPRSDTEKLVEKLAEKHDVPAEVIEQAIAEWSAGREKVDHDEDAETKT